MGGATKAARRAPRTRLGPPPAALLDTAKPDVRREGKVLRGPFGAARPGRELAALLAKAPAHRPGAWALAAAEILMRRAAAQAGCGAAPPERWLGRLADAFGLDAADASICRARLEAGLSEAVWRNPALPGELLLAARAAAKPARDGRAGRLSAPCVYTPPELARSMIRELHVGPRCTLDPSCGAGIFLLCAFERAFRRRVENGQPPAEAARRVLEHELAGCDVDAEALALAEFSLRLAAWEAAQLDEDVPLRLAEGDALAKRPDLEDRADVVVGNPPFVEARGLKPARLAELRGRFRCLAQGKVNLFAAFVERGLELLRPGGVLAFVLPATFQRNERYRALRELLLEYTLESIAPVEPRLFEGRVVETVVLRVRKQPPARSWRVRLPGGSLLQHQLPLGPAKRFCDAAEPALRRQVRLMEKHGVPLEEYFEVRDGISTGFQPFPHKLLGRLSPGGLDFVADDGTHRPFDPGVHVRVLDGGEIASYAPMRWEGRWLEYDKRHEHQPPHPGRSFNCQLRERAIFDRDEKLLSRQTARGLVATLDRERFFARNSLHVTYVRPGVELPEPEAPGGTNRSRALSLAALCACFNSAFYTRYFLAVTGEDGGVFPQVHIADVRRLPILPGLLRKGGPLHALGGELLALHATEPRDETGIAHAKQAVENLLQAAFGMLD
ncbi:MAG: N-6 DNA methylase [Planctomycetota bacterium]|nr:N-6 DNA methylase [Planctomycetota bacterium]